MGFRSVLENNKEELTPSEERIASTLLADPRAYLLLSAAELAERVSVHESTVIRFAQKLGYTGYPELRSDLLADVGERNDTFGAILLKSAEHHDLNFLVQEQIQILSQLPNHISQESLDEAAKAILSAHRVFLFGQGFTRTLVENFERKLRFLGFEVVAMQYGGNDLAEHFVSFDTKDLLLAFTFQNQGTEVARLLHLVQEKKAASIVISDHSGLLLKPAPSILLAAPRGPGSKRKLLVPLLVCYALEYAIIHFGTKRVKPTLENLDKLKKIFASNGK